MTHLIDNDLWHTLVVINVFIFFGINLNSFIDISNY